MSGLRRALATTAWMLFLGLALATVHRFPNPSALPLDASGDPGAAAALAVVRIVRLATLALGWYLLVATGVALACRLLGCHAAAASVAAATPRFVRQVLQVVAGISLLSAPVPAMASGPVPAAPVGTATEAEPITMRRVDAGGTGAERQGGSRSADGTSHEIVMRRLPDVVAADDLAGAGAAVPAGAPRTWKIESGQHLWSIAAHLVGEHLGREATYREVDPYWRRLLAANQHRLPDPDTPDLVFPGDVLDVPPVVAAGG